MAVIQDLPTELLYRILDLLPQDEDPVDPEDDGVEEYLDGNLDRTSLVARAWLHPSRERRLRDLDLRSFVWSYGACALRPEEVRPLSHVELSVEQASAVLELLRDLQVPVEGLGIGERDATEQREVRLWLMTVELLQGLIHLDIDGPFFGAPLIPTDITINLRALTLTPHFRSSSTFMDSLLGAAPFLTQLELWGDPLWGAFPTRHTTALLGIAPQLRHLSLHGWTTSGAPGRPPSFDALPFLARCTSLKSLELSGQSPARLTPILKVLRAPLALLETSLLSEEPAETISVVAELIALLDLPALANLKRWRMETRDELGGLEEQDRALWEAACRARGVEPRDERRFFTDLC